MHSYLLACLLAVTDRLQQHLVNCRLFTIVFVGWRIIKLLYHCLRLDNSMSQVDKTSICFAKKKDKTSIYIRLSAVKYCNKLSFSSMKLTGRCLPN
jgi:hypothetical protein